MVNHDLSAETAFRWLLRNVKPVAFEDAAKLIQTPEGFDRRAFGAIPAGMHRDGEIAKTGFRQSKSAKHHSTTKQFRRLA